MNLQQIALGAILGALIGVAITTGAYVLKKLFPEHQWLVMSSLFVISTATLVAFFIPGVIQNLMAGGHIYGDQSPLSGLGVFSSGYLAMLLVNFLYIRRIMKASRSAWVITFVGIFILILIIIIDGLLPDGLF